MERAVSLTTDDFDYYLDDSLIAQMPCDDRAGSRMMHLERELAEIKHDNFVNFTEYLKPEDVLVFNDTKVFPARLFGTKETGGKIECLVERICSEKIVLAHIKSSRSPKPGAILTFSDQFQAKVLSRQDELFELEFLIDRNILDVLQEYGRLPLPPYIQREPSAEDYERYQTIFAKNTGAVAAPTAALHFDDATLTRIKNLGVSIQQVTLHVGAGTFQPVRVSNLQEHKMHSEWINVSADVCNAIQTAQQRGGRVIAVGTTVMRALESASQNGSLSPFSGETDIFIYPGYRFNCVDALLTNFHLPKSTLLMLISAFADVDLIKTAYLQAVEQKYRFFSYGDCMLIT
jgi:S-adenosylmethionine:tRNA ribosyltransferase-isomerase